MNSYVISCPSWHRQDAVGHQFEPYPYCRMCLQADGALVVWSRMLFPNNSDCKAAADLCLWILIWILWQDTSWYFRIHSFRETMPDIMTFCLFMGEIILEIMSVDEMMSIMKNIVLFKKNSSLNSLVLCSIWQACSRATCLTVSQSVLQNYSANTCHLGLITHPALAMSAPSSAPTWISAALPLSDLSADSEPHHCSWGLTSSSSVQ